ncbi:DNA cytosine methyltransferase [Rosistilla oblonga]|uniref:DNA cytosine methyltransferase n=1 Tax=Rosistilla oblonga TaxID=2527990 RepID=UPI003A977B7E
MLECIELFAGAGGLSLGLKRAKIKVRVAVDCEADCQATYVKNQRGVEFIVERVQNLTRTDLLGYIDCPANLVLAGGPPCQLFSKLNRSPAEITDEVRSYIRLVRSLRPLYVVFENVPAIKRRSIAWTFVVESLVKAGYQVQWKVVRCDSLGIPQRRDRMIVLASRVEVQLPEASVQEPCTVRDAIGHFPECDASIPNHISMSLSDKNLSRIRSIKAGENSRSKTIAFCDSYSRMSWDRPAPTITTKCISFSNGRFGHPEYDRAITVREAANLQSFPEDYEFVGSLWSCARQVGNAVPPVLGEMLGKAIMHSYRKYRQGREVA